MSEPARPRTTVRLLVGTAAVALAGGLAALPASGSAAAEGGTGTVARTAGDHDRAAQQRRGTRAVWLTFEQPHYDPGQRVTTVANAGSAAVNTSVDADNGGDAFAVVGRLGGTALGLPEHNGAASPPHAVVSLVPTDAGLDGLDPGTSWFTFGASFRLDDVSDGDAADNGDNLVQRGLYDAVTQYKLQLDRHRASCRVKGRSGAVAVTVRQTLDAGVWYRAQCTRESGQVRLVVTRLADGFQWAATRTGTTGSMTPVARRVPLSVGGKLDDDGTVAASSDQFNGDVDDVAVRVD